MAAASILCHLGLQKAFQDQQLGLIQTSFKLLLPWVLDYVRFCVCPLRLSLYFPKLSGSSKNKSHWP